MSVFEPGWPKMLAIYNTSTGKIRMAGVFNSPADANEHTETGEAWLEGIASPNDHHIVNGVIQEKTVDTSVFIEATTREIRAAMLAETDWTQTADSPLTDAKKAEWRTYRQKLRDLSDHVNWPELEDFDWPTKP